MSEIKARLFELVGTALKSSVRSISRHVELEEEVAELRQQLSAIHANSMPDTLGNFCDAPDSKVKPCSTTEHYAAHLRAINAGSAPRPHPGAK